MSDQHMQFLATDRIAGFGADARRSRLAALAREGDLPSTDVRHGRFAWFRAAVAARVAPAASRFTTSRADPDAATAAATPAPALRSSGG